MSERIRTSPAKTLMGRRRNIAMGEAKQFIGVLYGVLSIRINPKRLRRAADWQGVIQSMTIELQRYADSESRRFLSGDGGPR